MQDDKRGGAYPGYGYEQYEIKMSSSHGAGAASGLGMDGGLGTAKKKGLLSKMAERRIRVPVLAGAALIVAVAGFSMLIGNMYPDDPNANVPVVRAEKVAFKEVPAEPGGMEIAHSDSTVFETFRADSMRNEAESEVENLLRESGQPMDKLEAFAQQVEQKLKEQEMEKEARMAALETQQQTMTESQSAAEADILQQITPAAGDASVAKPAAQEAGQAPDTLEFVRSVLDDKQQGSMKAPEKVAAASSSATADASKVASIEPAAGAAVSAGKYTSGLYFVQLASIGDRSRAPSEWGKMQKTHGAVLQGVNYRVTKADLGAKGIFYRIQAGPFSKNDAHNICDQVKKTKPGGCFVLK